jgi:YCII-related domain
MLPHGRPQWQVSFGRSCRDDVTEIHHVSPTKRLQQLTGTREWPLCRRERNQALLRDPRLAGYTLIQVKSRDEAVEWARRFPNPGQTDGEIEVRQLFELDDFEPSEAIERVREMGVGRSA